MARLTSFEGMGLTAVVLLCSVSIAVAAEEDDNEKKSFFYFTFIDVWRFCVYWMCLWLAGRFAEKIRFPSLAGEIVMGILLGPHVADFVPFYPAVMMIGQVGLLLEMVHLGLETNIDQLRAIGTDGLIIAIFSTAIPFAMAYGVAVGIGLTPVACFTVAIALSPTAVGVTAKVLHSTGILHTPVGQLIVTVTVIDDLIAIMLLGELQATYEEEWTARLWPILSPLIGVILVGYLALHVCPDLFEHAILPNVDPHWRDQILLLIVGAMAMGLTRAAYESKAFFLMGAFLTGVCFSTCHEVHHVWEHQIKRIQYALLRIFYGGSIAFEVPAKQLGKGKVWAKGFAFATVIFAKILAGFSNTSYFRGGQFDYREGLRMGFGLAVFGEITLLVGVTGKEEGFIGKETFSALVIAVLISVFVGPMLLYVRLKFDRESKRAKNFATEQALATEKDGKKAYPHFLFYTVDVSCSSKWGLLQKLLRISTEHSLEIIDFRVHGGHHTGKSDIMFEMYLKDTIVLAPLSTNQLQADRIEEEEAKESLAALDEQSFRTSSVSSTRRRHSESQKKSDSTDRKSLAMDEDSVEEEELQTMKRMWSAHKAHIASEHEVQVRLKDLKEAYCKVVDHDPRVAEMNGVIIQRWEPPLDEAHPENDDEMAMRFAEHVMHRIQFSKTGEHGYAFEDEVHRRPFELVEHKHLPPAMTDLAHSDDEIDRSESESSRARNFSLFSKFRRRNTGSHHRPPRMVPTGIVEEGKEEATSQDDLNKDDVETEGQSSTPREAETESMATVDLGDSEVSPGGYIETVASDNKDEEPSSQIKADVKEAHTIDVEIVNASTL